MYFYKDFLHLQCCWSPAPAARDSTWKDGPCRREKWDSLSIFIWTAYVFQAYDSLLYLYKSIRSEVWYFQFPLTQICCLHKSLLPFKQNFCFSSSLWIVFTLTCDCIVTHAYIWAAYHKPQFISYLSKSCLTLTSWASYLLKRLLAIVSLKIPNFYKL